MSAEPLRPRRADFRIAWWSFTLATQLVNMAQQGGAARRRSRVVKQRQDDAAGWRSRVAQQRGAAGWPRRVAQQFGAAGWHNRMAQQIGTAEWHSRVAQRDGTAGLRSRVGECTSIVILKSKRKSLFGKSSMLRQGTLLVIVRAWPLEALCIFKDWTGCSDGGRSFGDR